MAVWLKVLHLFFVIAWFVMLFYLPRLFIYHLDTTDDAGQARFHTMQRRLYVMGHIGMAGTLAFGLALLWQTPIWWHFAWLHIKLVLVAMLVAYTIYCGRLIRQMQRGERPHSGRWLRLFNEVPGLLLLGILYLVIAKPG